MPNKKYAIVELFTSIQGEGAFTGTNMLFVRLAGCNLNCHFCDEPLHKQKISGTHTAEMLVEEAHKAGTSWVCITGGEPSIQDLNPLIESFQMAGFQVMVESNGFKQKNITKADHKCLSPKGDDIPEGLWDSVKILVDIDTDLGFVQMLVNSVLEGNVEAQIYVQPINYETQVNDESLEACFKMIEEIPALGLSIQLHKILGVQ